MQAQVSGMNRTFESAFNDESSGNFKLGMFMGIVPVLMAR